MEGEKSESQKAIKGRKPYKGKYATLVNKLVVCRWIDITSYDLNGLDEFLKENEYAHKSYIFITCGKFLAEDDTVIIISPNFTEKNPEIKTRKASVYAIPKGVILEIAELDFVDCEEAKSL